MNTKFNHDSALELLREYNKEPFHILHGLTVGSCMKWFAKELGYGEDQDFWEVCGILHDIDFEMYPEEHCRKAPELLQEAGVGEDMIHSVCSHGYGICSEEKPEQTNSLTRSAPTITAVSSLPLCMSAPARASATLDEAQAAETTRPFPTRKTVCAF